MRPTKFHVGALLLYSLAFAVWFHPVVAHPGSRVACCVSDGTSTLRDLWVAGQQHDNPFTFTHDAYNGAPEGTPRATATVFANSGLQTGFVWLLRNVLGEVGAWNLFLALGIIGTAFATFALLRHLGCSAVASLFGGYVFGFAPYALERAYAGHLGLLQNWALVLVVLAMIRIGKRPTVGSAALAGAAIGLAFWIGAYQGLFASLIAFAYVLVDVVRAGTARERGRSVGLLALAYGIGAATLVPVVVLYARERGTVQTATARATSDLYTFAARITDYLVPSPRNPLFHWVHGVFSHGLTEHSLFVGYVTIVLAITAVILLVRRNPWIAGSEVRLRTTWAMVSLAVLAFVLSFAPSYRIGSVRIPMPSALLGNLTTNWRVYSRFGEVVGLALVVLASVALSALARRPGAAWRYAAPAALVVVLVELLPGNVGAFDTRHGPPWVEWLASQPRGLVATYPMSLHGGPLDLSVLAHYQRLDHDPGFEIVARAIFRHVAAPGDPQPGVRPHQAADGEILSTEGVATSSCRRRLSGLGPASPAARPGRFTLLQRLGNVRVYTFTLPRWASRR